MLGELHASLLPLLANAPEISDQLSVIRGIAGRFNFQLGPSRDLMGAFAGRQPNQALSDLRPVASSLARKSEGLIRDLARRLEIPAPSLPEPMAVYLESD